MKATFSFAYARYAIGELVVGVAHVMLWFAAVLGLYAAYLFGCQVIEWLRYGFWIPLPASSLFLGAISPVEADWLFGLPMRGDTELGPFSSWLAYPQSWVGVHRIAFGIVDFISTPIALAGLALVILIVCGTITGSTHSTPQPAS